MGGAACDLYICTYSGRGDWLYICCCIIIAKPIVKFHTIQRVCGNRLCSKAAFD